MSLFASQFLGEHNRLSFVQPSQHGIQMKMGEFWNYSSNQWVGQAQSSSIRIDQQQCWIVMNMIHDGIHKFLQQIVRSLFSLQSRPETKSPTQTMVKTPQTTPALKTTDVSVLRSISRTSSTSLSQPPGTHVGQQLRRSQKKRLDRNKVQLGSTRVPGDPPPTPHASWNAPRQVAHESPN